MEAAFGETDQVAQEMQALALQHAADLELVSKELESQNQRVEPLQEKLDQTRSMLRDAEDRATRAETERQLAIAGKAKAIATSRRQVGMVDAVVAAIDASGVLREELTKGSS